MYKTQSRIQKNACSRAMVGIGSGEIELEPLNFGGPCCCTHAPKPDRLDTGKTEVHTADSSVVLLGRQAWYNCDQIFLTMNTPGVPFKFIYL